jgi:hypothetical protein
MGNNRHEKEARKWDRPTMTIKTDSKKRMGVPNARPVDVFTCEAHGNGHFHLVRLNHPY